MWFLGCIGWHFLPTALPPQEGLILALHLALRLFIEDFVCPKVESWSSIIETLNAASSSPHAAYKTFTHGITSYWLFLFRTTPNICHLFTPLEELIRTRFIPNLTGRASPSDLKKRLFSLPVKLGGLKIFPPTLLGRENVIAKNLSSPLSSLLLDQSSGFSMDLWASQEKIRSMIHQDITKYLKSMAEVLLPELPKVWAMPYYWRKERCFYVVKFSPSTTAWFGLHKGALRDALALWYGWMPKKSMWNVCVVNLSPFKTPCPAADVAFQLCDTTKSETLQLPS